MTYCRRLHLHYCIASLLVLSLISCAHNQAIDRPSASPHVLDPLSAYEIKKTVEIIKSADKLKGDTRFALIELNEPDKEQVKNNIATRQSYALMYDWENGLANEAIVDLELKKLLQLNKLATNNPPNTYLTVMRLKELVFVDPRWKKAMANREITSNAAITLWPNIAPFAPLTIENGDRITDVLAFNNNPKIAQNIELPFDIRVNLTKGEVVEFTDREEKIAIQSDTIYNRPARMAKLQPLSIIQKNGPSFDLQGSELKWQNWNFHFAINPRRGLELYDIKYIDRGRQRQILYRASISEIVTPYGDPDWDSWYPSDVGDLIFSNYALLSAIEHKDTPPNTKFVAATIHDSLGNAKVIPKGIAIYERDGGLLWRHYTQSRRARELVLSSHFMVDNYDYVLSWIFSQNGSIKAQLTLSGVINFGRVKSNKNLLRHSKRNVKSNTIVAKGITGPIHQHFFNFRLDFDVDGTNNSVQELNSAMIPKQQNNNGEEWFATTATTFKTESDAKRRVNLNSSRQWKIINPFKTTELGHSPAYILRPEQNTIPYPGVNSNARKKYGLLDADIWVTPYSSREMYSAGKYLGTGFQGEGLPKWTQNNRIIHKKDIVVWYTLGVTHMPRPEDWPVMPAKHIGFEIMPFGFFNENPSMDINYPDP